MKEWILQEAISKEDLEKIELEAKQKVKESQKTSWNNYLNNLKKEKEELENLINIENDGSNKLVNEIVAKLEKEQNPNRKLLISSTKEIIRHIKFNDSSMPKLENWLLKSNEKYQKLYSSHLYSESHRSIKNQNRSNINKAIFSNDSKLVDGRIVLRDNFDALLKKHPELIIFGEDSGKIGDVNQGLEGLQTKYGEDRVFDTGIREATIIGQGIGLE